MGIFDFFKQDGRHPNHKWEDDDRELSLELRKSKAELKKQKQELELEIMRLDSEKKKIQLQAEIENAKMQLEDLQGYDEGEPEESHPEDAILNLFMAKILSGNTAPVVPTQISEQHPQQVVYSEQEIQGLIDQIPSSYLKIAKKMDDATLRKMIISRLPNTSEESIQLAITLLRER